MEWVETSGKSLVEAKDRALDQLGVAADEAEFDVLEEPRAGLFGRMRGEARVRARVRPAAVRPKQERRPRGRNKAASPRGGGDASSDDVRSGGDDDVVGTDGREPRPRRPKQQSLPKQQGRPKQQQKKEHQTMDERSNDDDDRRESTVTPAEVGEAAVTFMAGLSSAFGADATVDVVVDGTDLDVRVTGHELGLMVGPGGRTLMAVQDLARVASQRRLGDHDTRLRVDVGGYRERRRVALEKFAAAVAQQVIDSGVPKALEPMSSLDRKIVHDAIIGIDGVTSHSEGDDPTRRVVITPD
jgi:spoIIIJ-associated protein